MRDLIFNKRIVVTLTVVFLVLPLLSLMADDIVSDYRLFQMSMIFIAAIAVLGLNLLTGFNGQISIGHGAFYALGAYVAAVTMEHSSLPYWTTPLAAGLVSFISGYLFGRPALKLEGPYLALATFSLALAVPQILKYRWLEGWTGGVQGIVLIKPEAPFGLPLSSDQWLYLFCFLVMAFLYWCAHNLIHSRWGRAIIAIRDNKIAADTMGIDTAFYKSVVFGISAAYTGIAGALSAFTVAYVAPDSFNIFVSIKFFVGMVVGGVGSLAGSLLGGAFFVLMENWAQDLSLFIDEALGLHIELTAYTVYGILLIALMYLMPGGIAGAARQVASRLSGRRASARNSSAAEAAP